ncbi:uncharacterized protein [Venturia canescens]|uniref:uncharacterized protein n=1 Tax=Venturia canescens TaxID=32260 RepID=UPI001C9BD4CA|nr:uncharacterized protein LOC122412283 [Venturia canescens]
MKFLIFCCIFVALAYHGTYARRRLVTEIVPYRDFPALVEGNCMVSDIPTRIIDGCYKVQCTKQPNGTLEWSASGCTYGYCPNGERYGTGPHDLSKKFPNCCYPVRRC